MSAPPSYWREAKSTLALAAPMIAGQVSQMLMYLIDSAMVGRVGVVPLAAAAFGNTLLGIPMLIGIGLLTAVSVQVSQAHGGGRSEETGEVLRHGFMISIIFGVALALAVWVTSFYLTHFGQTPEVAAAARRYFIIHGFSFLPMLLTLTLKQFSEALSHPVPPMLILMGSVLLNAALNWVLIYGHLGAPALGLEGAAWGTLVGRTASFLALLVYVRRAGRFAGLAPARLVSAPHRGRIASMLRIGVPAAGMLLLEGSAFSIAAIMLGWMGAVPLAAHQIALSCASTTFMLPLGISLAVSIRVGQATGAGDGVRVRTIGLSAYALGLAIMAVCGVVFVFAGEPIARLFVKEADVSALATRILLVCAAFQMFDGLQVIASGSLRGLADVTVPLVFCIVAYWLVALPSAWFLGFVFHFGPLGVWYGLALGLACAAGLLAGRFIWRTRLREA